MDRATLEELRTRVADCVAVTDRETGPPVVGLTEAERDALFAYIDELERENRKMMEALEEP